ncbi:MAG: hypothetical protein H7138_23465 [Myxococcales bacterium]|nr:hypothetical protein [Myxococcales bacterium]
MGSPALPPANRRGVSFNIGASDNPLITRDANQGFALTSAVSPNASTNLFEVFVFDKDDASTAMVNITFVTPGAVVRPGLSIGFNRVCVTPKGQNPRTNLPATSCIDVAYVP